jgi:cytochrome c peroxidase
MHNGVYKTLEQVMDFYNRGGGAGIGIDLPNQTLPSDSLNLTIGEQEKVIEFIQALTDTTGLTFIPKQIKKKSTVHTRIAK